MLGEAVDRGTLHRRGDVAVDVHRRGDCGVAKSFLRDLRVHSEFEQQGRVSVPWPFESDPADVESLEGPADPSRPPAGDRVGHRDHAFIVAENVRIGASEVQGDRAASGFVVEPEQLYSRPVFFSRPGLRWPRHPSTNVPGQYS